MLPEHTPTGHGLKSETVRAVRPEKAGPTSARLGGARADFVAGLGRKVTDLRSALGRVRSTPEDTQARDELRRKLHALASAAKMMKFDAMDRSLAEALGTLDRTREGAIDDAHLEALETVIEDLPALAWGDGKVRSSRAEVLEKPAPQYEILVVGSAAIAEALLEDGPPQEGPAARPVFDCKSTPDAQAAFDIVRSTEPDLVLLDADLTAATELVEALMDDPLTEGVPVVVVGSFLENGEAAKYVALGVARTVNKPTTREALRLACEETLEPSRIALPAYRGLGEPTLEELGERLCAELREAIVGHADPAMRSRRIALGQGTEVLGAVWGAIARVREVLTARTGGTIRFAGGPEGALAAAAVLCEPEVARSDRSRTTRRGAAAEVRLAGRKIVVADDDPGVVWFLADLLKTAGCIVHEAFDGQQALELAYRTSPDLVISDILMPHVDGFSLCRALRRDVALRDTPVILLSWKEDLLQRVRELGADAAGYVRKESDTRAILARVREALRTRGRIEARLREDGEVRGRLDGISIKTLLDVVCATRPEARVSVRDATFLYEVEIRWGAPHRVTRTSGDGRFAKGSRVLSALLGVSAGRFTVATSTSPVDAELDGNLAAQLAKPIARARAAMSLLTSSQMHAVGRVRLDEEALEDYLRATPERARVIARRLVNGAPPRELVMCGGCEPALLDDLLTDLASRGIVIGVEGHDGEDLLLPAVHRLVQHTDARASFAPRMTGTPSPVPALADALRGDEPEVDLAVDQALAQQAEEDEMQDEDEYAESPASLEAAVLREMLQRSPEPAHHLSPLPYPPEPPAMIDPQSLRPRTSPPPPACLEDYGTPPLDQLLALGEPTVIDDTLVYTPNEPAASPEPSVRLEPSPSLDLPIVQAEPEDASDAILERQKAEDLTPFATVAPSDEEAAGVPKKTKRKWPMVAFLAGAGVVAWAVIHLSAGGLPKQHESAPPPAVDELPPPARTAAPVPPPTSPAPPARTADSRTGEESAPAPETPENKAAKAKKPASAARPVEGSVQTPIQNQVESQLPHMRF